MTLRTKSKTQQWLTRLVMAFVLLFIYAFLSRCLYGEISWNVFLPHVHRIALPLFVTFLYLAYESRWDSIVRHVDTQHDNDTAGDTAEVTRGQDTAVKGLTALPETTTVCEQPSEARQPKAARPPYQPDLASADIHASHPPASPVSPVPFVSPDNSSDGEALFLQARELTHQRLPDFTTDAEYMKLLGQSAALGYAPALAKLGDYAMRRAAWVEAYYWMSRASQCGMRNLYTTLREIRAQWVRAGSPDEMHNVHPLYSAEDGALARDWIACAKGSSTSSFIASTLGNRK